MDSSKVINHTELKNWFNQSKRKLPWRDEGNNPYSVWISEIMLQQTQVAVVIPYFFKWMNRFPTIHILAEASLDQVIKIWEGLGYYSRARHIHEAARYLVSHFNGELPSDETELIKIKGLGPYTIGAILSFAFHQKKAAVDGNVIRVLTRYFAMEDDISKQATQKKLRNIAEEILPNEESWTINEALIELGATVCQKKARCQECPLKQDCQAYLQGKVDALPFKSKKIKIEYLFRNVAIIECDSRFLVKRGSKGRIMSDLYEFPYFEMDSMGFFPERLRVMIEKTFCLKVEEKGFIEQENHSFTRYQVRLYPIHFTCEQLLKVEEYEWFTLGELKELPFSSGHRKIFHHLISV